MRIRADPTGWWAVAGLVAAGLAVAIVGGWPGGRGVGPGWPGAVVIHASDPRADGAEVDERPAADGGAWTPPVPASSGEREADRRRMVSDQIRARRDGVEDRAVLEAMRTVPRHVFVPERQRGRAYEDTPLPIGHGQTISQPYMVAKMTELLELGPGDKVLEIGTGSGYQAAVLAQLTPSVYTIEIVEPLAERAAGALEAEGYADVRTRRADGYFGWEEHAPFDAIIVTAAAGHVPPPLWEQLKPGGRMVIPIGGRFEVQRLVLLEKTADGERRSRSVMAVRFVPFTRGEPE
jgi:protein-L-isoaspartate(D-aspartate) O-methyltransferase